MRWSGGNKQTTNFISGKGSHENKVFFSDFMILFFWVVTNYILCYFQSCNYVDYLRTIRERGHEILSRNK